MNWDKFTTKYEDIAHSILITFSISALIPAIIASFEIYGLTIPKIISNVMTILLFGCIFCGGIFIASEGEYYYMGAKYTKSMPEKIISMIISASTTVIFYFLTKLALNF